MPSASSRNVPLCWIARNFPRPTSACASPEAQTLGTGVASVYTQGRVTIGTWERSAPEQPYKLLNPQGQPMLLTPGPTFVELPDPGTPLTNLDEPGAAALNSL